MKSFNLALATFLFTAFSSAAIAADKESEFEPKVESAWNARGKEASEKKEKIFKSGAVSEKDSVLDGQKTCELKLESAFAGHADPESRKMLRKKSDFTGYSLLIFGLKNEKDWTQISFLYQGKNKTPGAVGVHKVAEGWTAVVVVDGAAKKSLVLGGEGCQFVFEIRSPLRPKTFFHPEGSK